MGILTGIRGWMALTRLVGSSHLRAPIRRPLPMSTPIHMCVHLILSVSSLLGLTQHVTVALVQEQLIRFTVLTMSRTESGQCVAYWLRRVAFP